MKTVTDIMIHNVLHVKESDSIHHARMILKDKGIRHLPVVDDESGCFTGLLTQRSLLNHAFNIVEKFGLSGLEKRESRTAVKEIMSTESITVEPDAGLITVGELFITKKVSCLPVVKQGELKGIVTSVDFVKLALHLLK
ncbi:MAG: CBS domain-containing protein [endosymbiont of Galathealinum brachiosum]|uniref:CBS domain-containing protein n=1 Tax=endosymbiont of Galathealinum brachiosum TaxID=2200906 RepID=A0A370D896_9GAMM|nr:MAG: CBS domain-containing protein [endosymbiont of Galathealinum brachiosum]